MKRWNPVWLTRAAALSAAIFLFAACSDSTGPGASDVDVAATQTAVDQVVAKFFTENQGVQSLTIFGTQIATAIPSIAPAALALSSESVTLHGMGTRLHASMTSLLERRSADATLMAVPTQFLGKTFEFNSTTGQYEPTARTGAPVDGVRFILYDGISTLNEVGYFDFIDRSNFAISPASIDVTLSVSINGVGEVLNYRITGSVDDTGGTLLVDGFLSDGTDQLNFDFTVSGSDSAGFNGDFVLSAGTLSLELAFGEDTGGAESIEVTITDAPDEIVFILTVNATGDIQAGSGIWFNNTLVAVFAGNLDTEDVTITNAEGAPLTQQELLSLAQIFTALEGAFNAMEGLFGLGLGLIGIAFFF